MKHLLPLLALLLPAATLPCKAADAPARPPNIVLIFIDDLGYADIGPFGSTKNRTPALDRMAAEGMKLTSFYAAPVCTPSRAQVLTGCYAKRVGLPNVIFPAASVGLNPDEHTVAELLRARGYATMAIGKWHVGDQPAFLPTRHGFDHYFGIPYSNDMGGRGGDDARPPLPLMRDETVIETLDAAGQAAVTARYTGEAVKFIRENKARPFFLYFPHTAVHVPLHPGRDFAGNSANGTYGDWVEEVDHSVGRVLDTLRAENLAENTLVVFTSDNGPWLTQGDKGGIATPLRGGKGGTFEGGVRVPTIAWWPGRVPAKSACDAVAGNIDFLPTFVSLAGGSVPTGRKIDGADISPLLLGKSKESPRQAHYYFSGNTLQAVRSGPWKLAITPQNENTGRKPAASQPDAGKPFTRKLYNLEADIGETTDVAARNPHVVQRLEGLIEEMDRDLGQTRPGPGVRPPGRADNPVGLYLPGHAPATRPATRPAAPKDLAALKPGDALAGPAAPRVANRPLTITLDVEPRSRDGILLAHGGEVTGYALLLRDGRPSFTVRIARKTTTATAAAAPANQRYTLTARLARDGTMTLAVDGQPVATARAPGLLPTQPAEDFCLGHDNRAQVADDPPRAKFAGTVHKVTIADK